MAAYLLAVYFHIFSTMLWFGYILFWAILIGPLTREFSGLELNQLLKRINEAIWPPALVPLSCRLKLSSLGWIALVLLIFTGGLILHLRAVTLQSIISGELFLSQFGQVLTAKLVLVVGLAIGQLLLTYRPSPWLIYLKLLMTLSLIGLSVILVH